MVVGQIPNQKSGVIIPKVINKSHKFNVKTPSVHHQKRSKFCILNS